MKPAISATAFQTWVTTPQKAREQESLLCEMLLRSGVLVQKFIAEVQTKGEWSFIFFNRQFSHAVLKRAKAGDFRVQSNFGGYLEEATPCPSLVLQAQRIVDAVQKPLLFARVDGVEVEGRFVLMELELIEPVLFLGSNSIAAQRFVEAFLALTAASVDCKS